jgi:hypothetical protein
MSGPARSPAGTLSCRPAVRRTVCAVARQQVLGSITRGTTAPNRLRRVDRWITGTQAAVLRRAADPLVVDLGYGASPITAVELLERLRRVRADVEVVGVEIDPARVEAARPVQRPGLTFRRGGFELPLDGRRPVLVRALNVLRQYGEGEAADAWQQLRSRVAEGGLVVDGTCDELGRRAAWVALGPEGPRTLTFSTHLPTLERPGDLAERLPKALIHRNVPGEPVHRLLSAMDTSWAAAAPYASFGRRQRWIRTVEGLVAAGWPVLGGRSRWRLGEVTVAWPAVAPLDGPTAARGRR